MKKIDNKEYYKFDELPKEVQKAFYDNYDEEIVKADVEKELGGKKLESFEFSNFDETNPKEEDGYEIYVHYNSVVDGEQQDTIVHIPISFDGIKVGVPVIDAIDASIKADEKEDEEDSQELKKLYELEKELDMNGDPEGELPEIRKEIERLNNKLNSSIKAFENVQEYIDYLTGTYIPDLKESGKEATAEDFEAMVAFLGGATSHGDWANVRDFIVFIRETMLPDLRRSGNQATSEDYRTGLRYLRKLNASIKADAETQVDESKYKVEHPKLKEGDTLVLLENIEFAFEVMRDSAPPFGFYVDWDGPADVDIDEDGKITIQHEDESGKMVWQPAEKQYNASQIKINGATDYIYMMHWLDMLKRQKYDKEKAIEMLKDIGIDYATDKQAKALVDGIWKEKTTAAKKPEKKVEPKMIPLSKKLKNALEKYKDFDYYWKEGTEALIEKILKDNTYDKEELKKAMVSEQTGADDTFGSLDYEDKKDQESSYNENVDLIDKVERAIEASIKAEESAYVEFEDLPDNIQMAFWKELADNRDFWQNVKDAADGDTLDEEDIHNTLTFDPETVAKDKIAEGTYDITFDFVVNGDKASYFVSCIMVIDKDGKYQSSSVSLLEKMAWSGEKKEG